MFGNSNSNDNYSKIDISLFVQKPYRRIKYLESNLEEDIDLKNQSRTKNLPDPISIREACSKKYVDKKFNDPRIIENTAHVDFIEKNLKNVRFTKVNSIPTLEEQLTPKIDVDQAISDGVDEKSLLRLDPDEKLKLDEQDSIVLNYSLTLPKTTTKLATKSYVDNKYIGHSIIKNTAHVDFKDKVLDNVRFVKVVSMPAIGEPLTVKYYVDNFIRFSVDEQSLLRLDPDEMLKLDGQDSIVLNCTLTSPKATIELPTKSYVDSLHENRRNRQDLSSVYNDQDNEFDNNKLINLDSVTINRNRSSHNEVSIKKYTVDSIGEGTLLRFIQTLENDLEISVGNDTYKLTIYNKIQITDTTEIKFPNLGSDLLQKCYIKSNNKNTDLKFWKYYKINHNKKSYRPFRSNKLTTTW